MKKSLVESNPPSATKYMKRFLSPSNQERSPYPGKEVGRKYDLIPHYPPPQPLASSGSDELLFRVFAEIFILSDFLSVISTL